MGDILWNPETGELSPADLEGFEVVIHLAGESVARHWTADRKQRILDSRTRGTSLLAQTLARLKRPPSTLISASAIGYYGVDANEAVDESGANGRDFLADVVRQWELSAAPARAAGIRVVHPRIGIVLSPHGGALERMLPFFKLGTGGRMGSGRQWMSWISMRDVTGGIHHAIDHVQVNGPMNLVAPHPVQNSEFTSVLGSVLSRPAVIPVPALALKLAFGEMASATVLASQRVIPRVLQDSGFTFQDQTLQSALRHELTAA